jgi:MtN3 and saliva related transmembrane protein
MLPQVIKTLKEKKAEEVSKKMLLVLASGVALWIVYGFMKKDLPIIATNIFSLSVNLTMLYLRIRYSRKDKGAAVKPRLSVS